MDIFLVHDGREIALDRDRLTLGRGGDADERFDDTGLSRLNSTVYRDGTRVWIVDGGSTNGTLVNGTPTAPSGTPLGNGDTIRIGNLTTLTVKFVEPTPEVAEPVVSATPLTPTQTPAATNWLPVALIAGALFIISVSAVVIVFGVLGGRDVVVAENRETDFDDPTPRPDKSPKTSDSPVSLPANSSANTDLPPSDPGPDIPNVPPGKKYAEMSDAEKHAYVEAKAKRIAQIIGNSSSEKIPDDAVERIKRDVSSYATRTRVGPLSGCRFGDNLQATFTRASKNAPFIVRAFNEKAVDPRIGLYLAMIESEHCVCLQSGTGPLGMFQFTYATAKLHFEPSDGVVKGANPGNPDIRCQPEPAARAAASYMKALTGRYGTGPSSVPLAIASYNSGEGGLSTNLQTALSSGNGLPRDFWTLIAKSDMLSKQFQTENFKYVPKFFAAAIIGENPQDFGLALNAVSTYTK